MNTCIYFLNLTNNSVMVFKKNEQKIDFNLGGSVGLALPQQETKATQILIAKIGYSFSYHFKIVRGISDYIF